MQSSHPYSEFENTEHWKVVDAAIRDLEKNEDVKLETAREYVVGYLCKKLAGKSVSNGVGS